jgi:hypothetical protein
MSLGISNQKKLWYFWNFDILYFDVGIVSHLIMKLAFQSLCCFKIKRCFLCESNNLTLYYCPQLDKYNNINDWTQGVSCKMLRDNPHLFEIHKTDFIIDFVAPFKTFWAYKFCKNPFCPIKMNFLISEIIRCFLKTTFRHPFIRWQTNHSSNFHFKVTKQFWTKTRKIKYASHISWAIFQLYA